MNEKVKNFIEKMKEEQQIKALKSKENELKERNAHLISLGLVETTEGFVYLDDWDGSKNCKWDEEKQKYYKIGETHAAIDVTDEEYQEILKYAPLSKKSSDEQPKKTRLSSVIVATTFIFILLNIVGGLILSIELKWALPIILVLTNCLLLFQLIIGYSRIVEYIEKKLEKE